MLKVEFFLNKKIMDLCRRCVKGKYDEFYYNGKMKLL